MLGEPRNQFFLTRAALSTHGAQKQIPGIRHGGLLWSLNQGARNEKPKRNRGNRQTVPGGTAGRRLPALRCSLLIQTRLSFWRLRRQRLARTPRIWCALR